MGVRAHFRAFEHIQESGEVSDCFRRRKLDGTRTSFCRWRGQSSECSASGARILRVQWKRVWPPEQYIKQSRWTYVKESTISIARPNTFLKIAEMSCRGGTPPRRHTS